MRLKKLFSFFVSFCIAIGIFCASPQVYAARVLSKFEFKGDIMPYVGKKLEFATIASDSAYMAVQMWGDAETDKMFTNSESFNSMLQKEGTLMDESDRVFKEGHTYSYQVMVQKYSDLVSFADDIRATVGSLTMACSGSDEDYRIFTLGFRRDTGSKHTHISRFKFTYDENDDWLVCKDYDGYVFEKTKNRHNFESSTYTCRTCGYVLPEDKTTKIVTQPKEIDAECGGSVTFSVEASGSNLNYSWRFGDKTHSLYDTSDYLNVGMKISGTLTNKLTISNFNGKYIGEYGSVYCKVQGARGTADSQTVKINIKHKESVYIPVDGNGHDIQCVCGTVMQKNAAHHYVSDVCAECGYKKGSVKTTFKSAELFLPDFTEETYCDKASESARFIGTGIKSASYKWFVNLSEISGKFDKDTSYKLRIYPEFEENFTIQSGEKAEILYGGKVNKCFWNKNGYFELEAGKPSSRIRMTFEPGSGSGIQAPQYIDEYGSVYFPECTFTKDGDEFFAWRVGEKLYFPDPEKNIPFELNESTAATAVWKSELTKNVELTMDRISAGDKNSDIAFYAPTGSDYKVSGAVWYEGDEVNTYKKLTDGSELDSSKDYTVQIALSGRGFASIDDLNVKLSGVSLSEVRKNGAQQLVVTAHILRNVGITVVPPADGVILNAAEGMTLSSDKFVAPKLTNKWSKTKSNSGSVEGQTAVLGEKYYLIVNLTAEEGYVFGGATINVNGEDYPVDEITVLPAGYSWVKAYVPFTAVKQKIKVSEKSGNIIINSPKNTRVMITAAFYDSEGRLYECFVKRDFSFSAGESSVNPANIFDAERFIGAILNKKNYKSYIRIFDNSGSLEPLSDVYEYKYKG